MKEKTAKRLITTCLIFWILFLLFCLVLLQKSCRAAEKSWVQKNAYEGEVIVYTIKDTDTWASLAVQCDVPMEVLCQLNERSCKKVLLTGEGVLLPAKCFIKNQKEAVNNASLPAMTEINLIKNPTPTVSAVARINDVVKSDDVVQKDSIENPILLFLSDHWFAIASKWNNLDGIEKFSVIVFSSFPILVFCFFMLPLFLSKKKVVKKHKNQEWNPEEEVSCPYCAEKIKRKNFFRHVIKRTCKIFSQLSNEEKDVEILKLKKLGYLR